MNWTHSSQRPWILTLFLALAMGAAAQAQRVYVNVNSPAGSRGDGRSWRTAYRDLQSALADPRAKEIWIARGTYTPTAVYCPSGQPGGSCGPACVAGLKTFHLRDGLSLVGGFKGTESAKSERAVQPVLLPAGGGGGPSGNLPDASLTVLDGSASASWHVVMVGDDVAQVGGNVQLSDLTIQGGHAAGTDAGTLNSLFSITSIAYAHDSGGGLYARYGSVVDLDNVTLAGNTCDGSNATLQGPLGLAHIIPEPLLSGGGAIFAADNGTLIQVSRSRFTGNQSISFGGGGGAINVLNNAALNVSGCTFSQNLSGRDGGAIRSKDAGDVHVDGSCFTGNVAATCGFAGDEGGGAIGCIDGNLFVDGSAFTGNYGQISGGAIFFHAPFDDGQTYVMTVNGSQFSNNIGGPFGGGAIMLLAADVHPGSYAAIADCLFTGNMAGQGGAVYESSFNTVAQRCLFKGNLAAQWGGAVLADNFGDVEFFEPIPLAVRKTLTVQDSILDSNVVAGSMPQMPSSVCTYPSSVDSAVKVLAAFAAAANRLLGTPDMASIFTDQKDFQIGGGAGSALMSGELIINNSLIVDNAAAPATGGGLAPGTGGGFLAGGVNGVITVPSNQQTYPSLDFAAILINNSIMFGNSPNDAATSDIEGVGCTEAAGVFLAVKP